MFFLLIQKSVVSFGSMNTLVFSTFTALLLSSTTALAQSPPQEIKLLATDGVGGDYFGHSVCVSDETVVVGAYGVDGGDGDSAGTAYIYSFNGNGWDETKLVASDNQSEVYFGYSVSVSGDTVVIGSPLDNDNGTYSGSLYVYKLVEGNWLETKLLASDGSGYDNFGFSVDVLGDTIVAGARWDGDNGTSSGSVYVFDFNGKYWEETKLLSSDGETFDEFGTSVAIIDERIVVGAPGDSENGTGSGSAYVFRLTGEQWIEEAKLIASDGASADEFGSSVAISGNIVVVGAYDDNNESGIDAGGAYIYRYNGFQWIEETKVTASDGSTDDYFGNSVAVDDDTVVVGTRYADENGYNSGSAYIYRFDGFGWNETKLLADDGDEYDQFGYCVSLSGNNLVVGAYWDDENGSASGSAYLFDMASSSCPDLNNDEIVGVNDLLFVIDSWGQSNSTADLNSDGIVDVTDLLIIVGNWGPCE